MPVCTRLSVAVALLVTVLLALTAVATGCLWSLQMPGVAVTAAIGGLAAVAAVLFAYAVARELPEDSEPPVMEAPAPTRVRLQQAPVVQLPPEYLAAVRKGAQARHAAFRAQAAHEPDAAVH